MGIFQEIIKGLSAYTKAHQFIKDNKLWVYVILPGIINIILLSIVVWIGWHYTSQLTDYLLQFFGLGAGSDGVWILNFFFLLVFRMVVFLVYLMLYKYMVLIFMAPFLALLSERTEEIKTGREFPFKLGRFVKEVLRGILIALRNITLELMATVLLLLIATIPVIGLLSPFLIFLLQTYFYGFSMIDYYNERHQRSVGESSRFIWAHKGLAISNGAVFHLLMMVPIVGLFVAPSYSIVAACLSTLEIENE